MIYRFRLAALQLESLQSKRLLISSDVETLLESLPHDLNAMYDKILQEEIYESHRPLALKFLRWLAVSYRPLWIEEVSEVCIIPPESELGEATILGQDRLTLKQLLNLLPNLVVLESSSESKRVSLAFVHFSVREYLTGSQLLEFPSAYFRIQMRDAHRLVAKECLAYSYLSRDMRSDAALASYSRQHWPLHAVTFGELDEYTRTKAFILSAKILSGNVEMLGKNQSRSFTRVTKWLNGPERVSRLISILRYVPYRSMSLSSSGSHRLKLAILYPQAGQNHTITPPAIICKTHRVSMWLAPSYETIVYDRSWSSNSMGAVSVNGCPFSVSHFALRVLRHISQGSTTIRLLWLEDVCGSADGFGIFEKDAGGTSDDFSFPLANRVMVYLFGKLEKSEQERHRSSSLYQVLTSKHCTWLSSCQDCHLTALEHLLSTDYETTRRLHHSRKVVFLYNFHEISFNDIRESLDQHQGPTSLPQSGASQQVVTTIGPLDDALPVSTDRPVEIHQHAGEQTFPKTRALIVALDKPAWLLPD